jgi:hypothetical protein
MVAVLNKKTNHSTVVVVAAAVPQARIPPVAVPFP